MKKFLVFIVLIVSYNIFGQGVASGNNFTEISNNYRTELGSGNFKFSVPLFDIETINPDFNLSGSMHYNAQAATSIYTGEGILGKGWSADFLPSIYRQHSDLWDEAYYKPNTADVHEAEPYTKPERINDLFEFNVFGIRGSFRLVYNSNNTISVNLVDSNQYIEVTHINTMASGNGDAKMIVLNGFTIKDSKGFSYNFHQAEESAIIPIIGYDSPYLPMKHLALQNVSGYNIYKRAFLLSTVTDKYNRNIITFTYKSYPSNVSYNNVLTTYNQTVIDKILVTEKANFEFTTNATKITAIDIKNIGNNLMTKISLNKNGIGFYNKDGIREKGYQFSYNNTSNTSENITNSSGNYLKADNKCADASLIYSTTAQRYDAGLLKTITLPQRGKIEVEYEVNTYSLGPSPQLHHDENYTYVSVPVSYNSANQTYSFSHGSFYPYSSEAYYVKFNSTLYTDNLILDENENPISIYPGLEIYSRFPAYPLLQGFAYENQCTFGEKIIANTDYLNNTVTFKRHHGLASNITNVQVYKKTLKPQSEWVSYLYGPSVRVKKIITKDHSNVVLNEQLYKYEDPQNSKMSSGRVVLNDVLWYIDSRRGTHFYKPFPVFYKYVSIEETGKGKTVYEMNADRIGTQNAAIAEIAFLPRNVWKYNEGDQLTEEQNNTYEYYKSSSDIVAMDKISRSSSVIKSYEGSNFKITNTEKIFDTITMLPVYSKIEEPSIGQTFEEQYTYEKLGNAYYQTKVDKFKNSTALNRSQFEYQQYGSTQAYNLIKTKVAKNTLPLEVEKEITGYDFGNITEYKTKDGTLVSQIWGYGNSKMVAELKNVSYSSISAATIASIKSASTGTTYNEANLTTALNSLRSAHPTGFVTTYIYKPLVGISSITDVNGKKETYEYDSFNRLYRVLNNEGLIIKEYSFNIKN